MRALLAGLAAVVALAGCAGRAPGPSPVDARPSPEPPTERTVVAPAPADTTPAGPTPPPPRPATPTAGPKGAPVEPTPEPPPPLESVLTPEERRQMLGRIVADTTAAGASVRRCAGRKLLPDQESVFDTARSMLDQARAALLRDELWRAESLARKARQLAASLNCPG